MKNFWENYGDFCKVLRKCLQNSEEIFEKFGRNFWKNLRKFSQTFEEIFAKSEEIFANIWGNFCKIWEMVYKSLRKLS